MRDELYDRDYQTSREELHAGIDRFAARIGDAIRVTFETMHQIEWAAPWKRNSKQDCTGVA